MDENTVAVGKDIDLETVILQNVDLVENIGAFKEVAASNCNSPSIGRLGAFSFAIAAAVRILSTSSPLPEPSVE